MRINVRQHIERASSLLAQAAAELGTAATLAGEHGVVDDVPPAITTRMGEALAAVGTAREALRVAIILTKGPVR